MVGLQNRPEADGPPHGRGRLLVADLLAVLDLHRRDRLLELLLPQELQTEKEKRTKNPAN